MKKYCEVIKGMDTPSEKGKRIKGLGFGGGFKYGSILSANSQFFIPTTEFNFEFLQI